MLSWPMVRAMMSRITASVTKPEPHQQPTDRHVLGLLLGERDAQLILGDQSLLNQQFAQAKLLALLGHRCATSPLLYAGGELADALDDEVLVEVGAALRKDRSSALR